MRLKYIDALRGIAILGVIVINTGRYGFNEYPLFFESFINQGERGVQLFFVVSSFTLFLSYEYRLKQGGQIIKNFFIRRYFRIAPLYYIGIIYYLWQDGFGPRFWLGDEEFISTLNIVSNFFFVHGINPSWITSIVPGGWSITVEMTFYMLIPFLVSRIKNLNQAITFTLSTLILAQLLKVLAYQFPLIENLELWKAYLNLYLPSQLPVFGCGIIAFFIVIKKERIISKNNLAVLCFLLFADLIWQKAIPPNVSFGFAFLLLLILLSQNNFKVIINRPMQFLGTISFSLYLTHFAILYWMNYWGLVDLIEISTDFSAITNYFLRLVLVLAISTPISYFTYKVVEQPMQKFGKWLIMKTSP